MAFRRKRGEPDIPAGPPEISSLSLADSQWRGEQLEVARKLVEHYCGEAALPPSLAQLDATLSAWHADDADRVDINTLVNAVGVTFGHHLAARARLTWVIATDDKGSDLALNGQPNDVLIYPCNLVAKRLVDDERDFIEPLFAELVTQIDAIRQRPG